VSVLDYARYAELFDFHGFRGNYPSYIVPAPKSVLLGLPDSKAADFEDFDPRPVGWFQDCGGPVPDISPQTSSAPPSFIHKHGITAAYYDKRRVEELLASGHSEASELWRQIVAAIEELHRDGR
jgi:hypothetical protein